VPTPFSLVAAVQAAYFYDGDRIAFNPTARFKLSPSSTVDLSYESIDNERFIDRGIPINDLTGGDFQPVEAFSDIVFGDSELNTAQAQAHVFRATLNQDFSENLKGVFNATEFNTGGIEHTIVAGAEYRDTSNDNDRFNPEFPFGANGPGDDREDFIIERPINLTGGRGVDSDGNAFTVAFTDLNDQTESDIKVFSAFIQDEISLSDNFDIVLGGYKPKENVSVYGSYSQTFLPRTGEQFAGLRRSSPGSVQSDILSPDEFENLEAGLKWDFTPSPSKVLNSNWKAKSLTIFTSERATQI